MSDDWFGGTPDFAKLLSRTEDKACRKVLSVAKISPGAVAKRLRLPGNGAATRLTFSHLRAAIDFNESPGVTDDAPDDLLTLFAKFRKSRLYSAWVACWDANPDVGPRERVMVFYGPAWGLAVMRPLRNLVEHPHVCVGHGETGGPYVIETFSDWLRSIGWFGPSVSTG